VETKPPIHRTPEEVPKQLDGGIAIVGVVVNPEGEIVSEPIFHKVLLHEKAAMIMSGVSVPKITINQHFHLQFKYDTATVLNVRKTIS